MQVTGPAAAAAAQSLAVDGDLAAFHGETETGEVGGDAGGEGGGLDGLEDAGEGVGAGDAVGQREPFAQPFFLQLAELFHEFVGSHAAEHGGEGDEEDLAEMVAGVATRRLRSLRGSLGNSRFCRDFWASGNTETTRQGVQVC